MNTYTVYKHTSPSGKVYIGITCLRPEKRWQNGRGYKNNPHFARAIELYGWSNIKHEILAEGITREAAERLEVELIEAYNATDKNYGYNLDLGGSTGPKHSSETRAKIGEANRHRIWSAEARAKVGAASRGRIPSEETRKKLSESRRGERNHNYGKKFSAEHRQKLSEARRGENAPNYGKHLSKETRQKIASHKKKKVFCEETGCVYPSIAEAAEVTGASVSKIGAVCNGRLPSTKGLHFHFVRSEEVVI